MKTPAFSLIGIVALSLAQLASAQVLFTTVEDFTGWTGNLGSTVTTSTSYDYDGSTVNGAGNLSNPGGTGTAGSLAVTWAPTVGTFNSIAVASYQGGNQAFLSVLDPGSSVVGNSMAAYSGTLNLVYSLPDNEGGNYFQLGILLQYDANGYYQTFFPSSSDTYLGTFGGLDTYQAAIPYTITAGAQNGFGFSIMYNSDYSPIDTFYIDRIEVAAVPEPTTIALLGFGMLGMAFQLRRRI